MDVYEKATGMSRWSLGFIALRELLIPINRVDAAAAELMQIPPAPNDLARLTFGGRTVGTATFALQGGTITGQSRVYKAGRTTGYTEGVVIGLGGTATIEYAPGQQAFFNGQMVVRGTPDNVGPFSNPGDSGSGVLNIDHELVGLLFAGSPAQTLVNPINDVLNQLAIALNVPGVQVVT